MSDLSTWRKQERKEWITKNPSVAVAYVRLKWIVMLRAYRHGVRFFQCSFQYVKWRTLHKPEDPDINPSLLATPSSIPLPTTVHALTSLLSLSSSSAIASLIASTQSLASKEHLAANLVWLPAKDMTVDQCLFSIFFKFCKCTQNRKVAWSRVLLTQQTLLI